MLGSAYDSTKSVCQLSLKIMVKNEKHSTMTKTHLQEKQVYKRRKCRYGTEYSC